MTRKKQQPTVVKVEVEEQLNLHSSNNGMEQNEEYQQQHQQNQQKQSSVDDIDTSQIMALLEKSMPDGLLKPNGRGGLEERELSPLTPAKANEILFAAGIRPHKKTSEIWEHYKCLNEKQNVECIYCWKMLKRNDSSTKSMWGHMNAYHQDILRDGTTKKKLKRAAFSSSVGEHLEETPTQPYVKRVRGGTVNGTPGNMTTNGANLMMMDQKPMIDSMAFALQQLQQGGNLADFNTSLNFLESLPKTSEVINMSNGFIKDEIDEDMENHVEAASSSSSDEPIRNSDSPAETRKSASPVRNGNVNGGSGGQITQTDVSDLSNNQLAAFVNLASTNPMMLAMLNAANSSATPVNRELESTSPPPPSTTTTTSAKDFAIDKKDPSSFSLSDGPCAAVLMSMALDLDMTMSYHRRRVDIELCFESNRTAEKSGGRGKVICLTDLGKEIKIIERVNGAVIDTELWTKTDFNQFHWAIRGKCQKCFIKA